MVRLLHLLVVKLVVCQEYDYSKDYSSGGYFGPSYNIYYYNAGHIETQTFTSKLEKEMYEDKFRQSEEPDSLKIEFDDGSGAVIEEW